jgi:hypothetical protein
VTHVSLAKWKDLCIDTNGGDVLGRFWAAALGLRFEPDGGSGTLTGPTKQHRVWLNTVPEPKTVKHRVHLDVHADSVAELVALGATRVGERSGLNTWTVMLDPEGGEFCAFVREQAPEQRLFELVVDAADPESIAAWWAEVFAGRLGGHADRGWWVDSIEGAPFEVMSFVPVPEPKTVKNRIHWDVMVDSLSALVDAGATRSPRQGEQDAWHVMTDPEGNEFCAFVTHD